MYIDIVINYHQKSGNRQIGVCRFIALTRRYIYIYIIFFHSFFYVFLQMVSVSSNVDSFFIFTRKNENLVAILVLRPQKYPFRSELRGA